VTWRHDNNSFFSISDEDDDNDDLYPSPTQDTVRLKRARSGRRTHGARINGGQSTTEC
jgi:hypothetical protein